MQLTLGNLVRSFTTPKCIIFLKRSPIVNVLSHMQCVLQPKFPPIEVRNGAHNSKTHNSTQHFPSYLVNASVQQLLMNV